MERNNVQGGVIYSPRFFIVFKVVLLAEKTWYNTTIYKNFNEKFLVGNKLNFKEYSDISNSLSSEEAEALRSEINAILKNAWGEFPVDFVEKHILKSQKIVLAEINKQSIGFYCANTKKILDKEIYYIEFLVVKKEFQEKNIGSKLIFVAIQKYILKNI